jgi:hypothetical protein
MMPGAWHFCAMPSGPAGRKRMQFPSGRGIESVIKRAEDITIDRMGNMKYWGDRVPVFRDDVVCTVNYCADPVHQSKDC